MSTMPTCPTCGALLPTGRPLRRYASGAEFADDATAYTSEQPARAASLEADVTVPILQTAATTAFTALACCAVADLRTGLAVGACTGALVWAALLVDQRRLLRISHTWQTLPTLTAAAPAAATREPVQLTVIQRDAHNTLRQINNIELPVSDAQLQQLARALFLERAPFSKRGLSAILSDSEYTALHAALRQGNLLWPLGKSPNAGYKLSPAGREFLRGYLPPTPE